MSARTIVVIEDEFAQRFMLQQVLTKLGHMVFAAENGRVGIEIIRQQQPDLIVCDLQMPEADGFEVLRTVRGTPALAKTLFILMSAYLTPQARAELDVLGVSNCIDKPFDMRDFLKVLNVTLS